MAVPPGSNANGISSSSNVLVTIGGWLATLTAPGSLHRPPQKRELYRRILRRLVIVLPIGGRDCDAKTTSSRHFHRKRQHIDYDVQALGDGTVSPSDSRKRWRDLPR